MQNAFIDFGMLWPRNIDRFSEDVVSHTLPRCIQFGTIWFTRCRRAEPTKSEEFNVTNNHLSICVDIKRYESL